MIAVQAGGGGYVHVGVYDGDVAGWHPRCGEKRTAHWFGCELAVTCPRCIAGIRSESWAWRVDVVLAAVEDIADELDRALDDENRDRQALIEDAVRRLRGLRELAKG